MLGCRDQHAQAMEQQPNALLQSPVIPASTQSVGDITSSYHSKSLFIYFVLVGSPENGIFKG